MSFYSSTWNKFCGHEGNVSIWDGRVLMPCFGHLCILVPCNCLLTIVSVYYTASARRIPNLYGSEIPWPVILRFISTILIIISNIVQILLSKFVFHYSLSYALSIFLGVSSCAWCIHTVYIYRLRWMYWENYRGPKCVIYVCVINLLAQILHTYNVITMHVHKYAGRDQSDEYLSYVKMFCLVMYFGTLILKNNRYSEISELHGSLNISPSETRSLLSDRTTFYDPKLEREDENTVAEENSSWLSKLTFHWVQPIMTKGLRQKIRSVRDLYILPPKLGTEQIEKKFDIILKRGQGQSGGSDITFPAECSSDARRAQTYSGQEVETAVPFVEIKYMQGKNKMTLFRALNIAFGMEYYMLGILKLLADIAGFAGPVLLNLLVSYIENHEEKESDGYFYAGGLMLCTFLGALFSSQFDYHCRNVGYKIRSAVITTIFKKSLSVNSVSVTKFSTGEIVNFMSTDTDRLTNFCPSFHAVWSLPFQIGVSLYLLYLQVGLAFLTGLAFALILIPINRWIANKIGELSKTMMEHKDSRVKMMNEVLFGLKIIKLFAWEEYFKAEIIERRKAELKSLRGRKYLDAMCVYFWATTPVLISILTFTTYSLMGNQLTAAKVFTSLSLFLMLISPLNAFPWVLNGLVEAWVSLKRVENFVQIPDCDLAKYYSQCFSKDPNVAVEVSEAEFSWKNTGLCERKVTADCIHNQVDGTLRLTNINFSIQKGQFVGVIGKVGSGKSSVLYAVLSEMCKLKGTVYIDDIKKGMAVVTQEAWIQHATVRDNILFGRDFVAQKYQTVVDATALYLDFQALPAGDSTEVGENGVTLSGGQKSRIALARALYQDKDIYLLDDPLAAVDAHVAQQLYSKCIMGILRNKTRILCTHHVKYLTKADIIIVMDNGLIKEIGKPEDILSHLDEEEFCRIDNIINEEEKEDIHEVDEVSGVLVKEEEKETGVVKFDVYRSYWRAVGNFLAPLVLISLFFMQASRNVSDWWLSYWISHTKEMNNSGSNLSSEFYLTHHDYIRNSITGYLNKKSNTSTDDSLKFYLTIYGCLAGANSVFTLLRAFLFAYGGICAAQLLHHKLLCAILRAPMKFFDVTPIGRILNRFSSDLYAIDDSLPFILNIFLAQFFGILGTIVVTCYGLPWFALLLLPLGAIYYKIQQYYRHTSREIKRITTVTLSPIYAHFSETVTGLITIRAFREEERFQRENIKRLDLNQRAQFIGSAVSSWLSFRLQMMGVIMVTGISFIAVLQHHYQSVDPGLVGLAISYALSVTNLLSGVVNSFTETEKQAVSVERAQQYIDDIPSECWEGSIIVNPEWPSNGVITFSSVYLKYRPNLPYALQNLSFKTYPAEKLGVVGRTGSGKSSLFQALFRIVELCSGSISIDNINVKSLNLTDLRRNLAIIPQDPFLFSGSVRKNLDPTSAFKDNALWNVLKRCHLKDVVNRLGGLQADVAERGKHFSVGQRQLLCLARAMLKKAKVLCIDEATASVDMETDLMLQDTIRREFCQSTVLTIAHRINTILDCDRVLVMDKGQVRELDSPGRLLQEKHSMFYQLVHGNNQF